MTSASVLVLCGWWCWWWRIACCTVVLLYAFLKSHVLMLRCWLLVANCRTRTRTNTNPNDTEATAAGRSGNARALRKQNKCGVIHEGEGQWPKFSQNCKKRVVGSAHSAETIKRKARKHSSRRTEHKVPLAEVKSCLSARRAPIVLPPGHERPWQGRNSFLVRRVAVNI